MDHRLAALLPDGLTSLLLSVVNALPVVVYAFDAAGTVLLAEGSALAAMASAPGAAVGRSIHEVFEGETDTLGHIRRALEGEEHTAEITLARNGRPYRVWFTPWLDESGRVTVVTGLSLDITAEVHHKDRAAAARTATERKSKLLAEVTHEVRAPLTSVIGFADLLTRYEHEPLTERQHRYVRNIRDSALQILNLINELLDTASVELGHFHVRSERVDVAALLDRVVERLSPTAIAANVDLRVRARTRVPALADGGRLLQVMLNLVSNGLKFTPAGGHVTLSAFRRAGTITLVVADDGVGIGKADKERIFDDFYQAPAARGRPAGTGLGLAVSRRLARAMGGDLTVLSSVGRGSAFRLTLPVWAGPPAVDSITMERVRR